VDFEEKIAKTFRSLVSIQGWAEEKMQMTKHAKDCPEN
jgi:hypothetical protein